MNKRLLRFFIIAWLIYWILYVLVLIIFKTIAEKEFDITSVILSGLFLSVLITVMIGFGTYLAIKPKIKYLESTQAEPPFFSNTQIGYYENVTIPFKDLKNEIAKKWIITYANDNEKIIKCSSKINLYNWGYGAYLKFDETNKNLQCVFFPLSSNKHRDNYLENFNLLFGCKLIKTVVAD